jgi:SAM-dependent methyltransferase
MIQTSPGGNLTGDFLATDNSTTESPSIFQKIRKHAAAGTLLTVAASTWGKHLKRRRQPLPYQAEKQNAQEKWSIVAAGLRAVQARSLLDVGCASGEITRLAARAGYFAAGIDQNLDLRGVEDPFRGVCLGEVPLTEEVTERLPEFDAVLLLSVQHQWVKLYGDAQARNRVLRLSDKVRRCLIVEFAAINSKYGTLGSPLFTDNNETSVRTYATQWLGSTLPDWAITYLGKCPDRSDEPFRYIFMCRRPGIEANETGPQ